MAHAQSFIQKFALGCCIAVTGGVVVAIVIAVLSSAQPPKCKLDYTEIKELIVTISEKQEVVSKKQDAFIEKLEKKQIIDSMQHISELKIVDEIFHKLNANAK